jgi:NodT family efflux transporter outer membrane factor (OMF) lipoprotein
MKKLIVVILPFLAACSVGPDYVRPSTEMPAAFKETAAWKEAEPADTLPRGKWWQVFGDQGLNTLEERVEVSNQNLRLAQAQYRQSQALARQAGAALFPTVSGNVSASRSQASSSSPSGGSLSTTHSLGLQASWETDLWGGLRRNIEAGEDSALASAADLAATRLSLEATLAQDWFSLRGLDAQKTLLDDTVAAYEKSLTLTRNRYAGGVASQADVAQAETQLKSTRAQALDVGVQRAQMEHAIALLVGQSPSTFSLVPKPLFTAHPPALPAGLPSALLERRPDVAAAERRVAAANAQIGVAKAAFFPDLSLSANGGWQSSALATWFSAPSRFWSLGPALAQTIFDGGLRSARQEQAKAAWEASVATYRQTVLAAISDVEDNLAALRILEREASVQDEALQAARRSLDIASNQYKAGITSYLNVVTAQAAALSAESSANSLRIRRMAAGVGLIRALGGGWEATKEPPAEGAEHEGKR